MGGAAYAKLIQRNLFMNTPINSKQRGIEAAVDRSESQGSGSVLPPVGRIPVLAAVSVNTVKEMTLAAQWHVKPRNLSNDSFAMLVVGRSALPEFQVNDYAYVETKVLSEDLVDGAYVVAQHRNKDYGSIKLLVCGDSLKDRYLTNTNQDIPSDGLQPFCDFEIIGIVKGKMRMYR